MFVYKKTFDGHTFSCLGNGKNNYLNISLLHRSLHFIYPSSFGHFTSNLLKDKVKKKAPPQKKQHSIIPPTHGAIQTQTSTTESL